MASGLTASKFLEEISKPSKVPSKNAHNVLSSVLKASIEVNATKGEINMGKQLKIKSNSYRDRIVSCGGVDTYFDKSGYAVVYEHQRDSIQKEMNLRPGRLSFVEEETTSTVTQSIEEALEAARKVIEDTKVEDTKVEDTNEPVSDESDTSVDQDTKKHRKNKKV